MTLPKTQALGLCSWSVQPTGVDALIGKVQQAGLSAVQLALEPLRSRPQAWADAKAKLADAGITIHSGMFEPVGEDYTTPATIRRTGGIVPDETWPENRRRIEQVSRLAAALGLGCVTFHAGFIPEQPGESYDRLVERLQWTAEQFVNVGLSQVLLETGQETAKTLSAFLSAVDRPAVGVNFDPANMLLYDMDDPIEALGELIGHVRQAHLKDAVRPAQAGQWGSEVVVGTGQVDWPAFCRTLASSDFNGPLIFEREAGDDRVGDIQRGLAFIRPLLEGVEP